MIHTLQPGETAQLTIVAKDPFSYEKIAVSRGQRYKVHSGKDQMWTDWFVKTDADGFFNLLAWLAGQRVKSTKCFCLCGSYNDSEDHLFPIGSEGEFGTDEQKGTLSFFANDSISHYGNNKGEITISVTRLQ